MGDRESVAATRLRIRCQGFDNLCQHGRKTDKAGPFGIMGEAIHLQVVIRIKIVGEEVGRICIQVRRVDQQHFVAMRSVGCQAVEDVDVQVLFEAVEPFAQLRRDQPVDAVATGVSNLEPGPLRHDAIHCAWSQVGNGPARMVRWTWSL